MRIFLTGASGYLGSVLARHFDQMPEVEGITGIGLGAPRNSVPAKLKFLRLDIRSPKLASLMAGHDVVVHTACVVFWKAGMSARERDDINLNGTRNVACAAVATGARRFLHASSMAVYHPFLARGQSQVREDFPLGTGDSPFYYWNAKALAERLLHETLDGSNVVFTAFRPIYIMGPHNRPTVASYRRNAVNFPGRNPRRQFIHEEDVARAFVLAARQDLPGAYNIVPHDFVRMTDVWQALGMRFVPTLPVWTARWLTWVRWRFLGSAIHPSWVEDTLTDFVGVNDKLRSAGWTPRYNSLEALQSAL